jgi:hypothetical protein
MIQLVSGSLLLLLGAALLISGLRRSRREEAGAQRGFLGRFGALMLGLIMAFLGVALLLPARDATPTPGVAPNPVDEAIQEGDE